MKLFVDDRVEILDLYARYCHAVDLGDAEGWAATFTEDATFDSPAGALAGREALAGFVRATVERRTFQTRHLPSNIVLDATEEGAAGRAYFAIYRCSGPEAKPEILATGMYEDTLVRTPEGWRFKSRRAKVDS
jgi:3-phenylpropionate/cinnamic acid dioxygenase small subunit